jgi:TPR repeat protein
VKTGKKWTKIEERRAMDRFQVERTPMGVATDRVARFFLAQTYQNGKNIPNDCKLYQSAINYTKLP